MRMSSSLSSVLMRGHHGNSPGALGFALRHRPVCRTRGRSANAAQRVRPSQWANSATASCSRQPSRAWTRTAQHERRRFNTHSAPPPARAVQSNGIFCLPDAGQRRLVGHQLRAASARQKTLCCMPRRCCLRAISAETPVHSRVMCIGVVCRCSQPAVEEPLCEQHLTFASAHTHWRLVEGCETACDAGWAMINHIP